MQREIEIKCLLDGPKGRDKLLKALQAEFPSHKKLQTRTVISYFYEPADSSDRIIKAAQTFLDEKEVTKLTELIEQSSELVVKARSVDDEVFFAVKGAPKGEDAVHAVNRLEFETTVDHPLDEINEKLEAAGFKLASKWSAKRTFYSLDDDLEMNVEFVSGYGHKAEIEIVTHKDDAKEKIQKIQQTAQKLGLTEASQELFGKMYHYYNQHWQDYFGTDKSFPEDVWRQLGRYTNG